jgi:hypothetical protein
MNVKQIGLLIILCFFINSGLNSQTIEWTRVLAGQQEEYGNAICIDNNNNVINTGSFQGICYGGTFALACLGSTDIFIEKLSPTGAVLWTRQYGGSGADNGFSVVTDSENNIYLAGIFTGTINFGNGTLTSTSSSTTSNFFVIKLDSNGTVLWRKAIPGSRTHRPKLHIDNTDKLYLTGIFFGERTFGTTTIDSDDGIAFLTRLNRFNGDVIWVTQYGSGTSFNGTPVVINNTTTNVSSDTSGNLYVTGSFKDHGRFGNQNIISSPLNNNAYIMKVNSLGAVLWTKVYTGDTKGTSIVVDSNDSIYVAGNYFGNVTINNINYSASPTYYSIFLQKLNANGDVIWFKNYDVKTSSPNDVTVQLAVSDNNTILLKSLFANTIQFENQTFTSLISTNPNVVKPQILALYNSDGENLWVNQYENPNDNIQFGIAPDKTTNIALSNDAIFFTSGSSRFNGISYSLESGSNIFTAKLGLPQTLTAPFYEIDNVTFNVFPNPTTGKINLKLHKKYDTVKVATYNIFGQLLDNLTFSNTDAILFDLVTVATGTLLIEVEVDGKKVIKKIIKL